MNISFKICSPRFNAAFITRDHISLRVRRTIGEPIDFLYMNNIRTLIVIRDQLEDE